MSRGVLKWNVRVDDTTHRIGAGPVVMVACQYDPGVVQVWTDEADVDHVRDRLARVYGTGQPIPAAAVHIGSVMTAGSLVWHVFASPFVDGTVEEAGR